jgi:membrane-associated phospholipid phosphatase
MTDRIAEETTTFTPPVVGSTGWIDRNTADRPDATDATAKTSGRASQAAAPLATLALVYVFSVWTVTGQRIENAGMIAADRLGGSTHLLGSLVYTSVSYSTLLFGLFVLAGFGLHRGGFRRAVVAPAILGVSIVVVELLKYVLLPRPRLYASPKWLGYPSFPSGHTTIAVGLAAGALFVATDRTRRAVYISGYVYGSLMGISLIVTANHRLSDEIGSCLVVYLAAVVASAVLRTGTPQPIRRPNARHTAHVVVVVVVVVVVALIVVGVEFVGFLAAHGRVIIVFECVAYLCIYYSTLRRVALLSRPAANR